MKNISLLIISIFIIGCSSSTKSGIIKQGKPYLKISFSLNTSSFPVMFFKKMYPQIAVWVSDKKGSTTRTIYVTGKGAKNDWFGAETRPSSIPVWYGIRQSEEKLKIDSVTGASPSGETYEIFWPIPDDLNKKNAVVSIEANVSFDYNEFFKKDAEKGTKYYSDVNGQPSLVWSSKVKLSGKKAEYSPRIIGHGHVLGKEHRIYRDMSKISSAKEIFHFIKIEYFPEQ